MKPLFARRVAGVGLICVLLPGADSAPAEPQDVAQGREDSEHRDVATAPAETESDDVAEALLRTPRATRAEIETAFARGVQHMLSTQRPDGGWGGPQWTGGVDNDPVPGAFQAFDGAVAALALEALLAAPETAEVRSARARAEEFLYRELARVRRADPFNLPNVWTHAYALQTLAALLARAEPTDASQRERRIAEMRRQLEELRRFETVHGGWFYYALGLQRPDAPSCSFVNAAVLVSMHRAREQGLELEARVVERALGMLRLSRKSDSSYLYALRTPFDRRGAMAPINRPAGSLGRSQACNVALRLWNPADVADEELERWLERLVLRQGWLDMGRKRPVPHESHAQVAGYFYYFGHYYGAVAIELLPVERRGPHAARLARILIDRQETDGSWFDYPLYSYHKPYGTAFAVLSLDACRRALDSRPRAGVEETGPAPPTESAAN